MTTPRTAATLRALRELPTWQLLAAHKAPAVLAVLRGLLADGQGPLAGSVLHERVARELDALRDGGDDLPQSAQAYVADGLRQGWLVRRLPEGAPEETYELSVDAAAALRWAGALIAPRSNATEWQRRWARQHRAWWAVGSTPALAGLAAGA